MPAGRARSLRDGSVLCAVVLLALAVRLVPFPAATRGGLRLLSPDCYGHLRRATSVARNFPRVPVRDPYLNHPDGAVWIWPPAFDLLIGGVARVAYGPAATTNEVARVAASLPPLLGALHIVPLFLFARRAFGRRRALLASTAYALLPAAAIWSEFGHADHHVAEALCLLLFLAAAAGASARRGGARALSALGAGAALALLLLTWQGGVASSALGFLWSAIFLGPAAAVVALAASGLTALGTALTLRGEPVPFAFVSFGWFQPAFVAAVGVPVTLAAAFRARARLVRAGLAVAALALSAAVLPRLPDLASAARRGGAYVAARAASAEGVDEFADGGYLSYPADFLKVVSEARPLLGGPVASALARGAEQLSAGLFLLPVGLGLWTLSALRMTGTPAARRRAARALAILFGGAFLVLTLLQRRNVYYLAIFSALALGDAAARVAAYGRRRMRAGARSPASLRAAAVALPLLVLCLLEVVPGLPAYARLRAYAEAPGPDLVDLLNRLRALDPAPADPAALPPPAAGSIPGVMAPWAAGHFVTALTGRPAAADPFAYGWRRQARLFTATDDAEARALLLGARCRYLITADLRPVLALYAAAAGRPPGDPASMFAVRVHESSDPKPVPFLTRVLDSRTAARTPDGRIVPRFRVWRVDGGP